MPCCYWSGTCRASCSSDEIQLSAAATCAATADVCCLARDRVNAATTTTTSPTTTTTTTISTAVPTTTSPTTAATTGTTTSTSTPPPSSVSPKQGACGRATVLSPLQPRIIGGAVAGPLDWPWMVRLTFTMHTGFCGAVLVSPDTVLTAAHCVAGVADSTMRVILGDYDLSTFDPDEEVVNVASHFVISNFQRGIRGHDLAVLKLARSVTLTERKLPVCLPDPTIPLLTPSQCYMAGWGVTEQGLGGPMRAVNVQLLDRASCQQKLTTVQGTPVTLPSDMICTRNPSTSPSDGCLFDDGDMLVCLDAEQRWRLVGIMSEYSCGGKSGLPVLFTDVSKYTDVILR